MKQTQRKSRGMAAVALVLLIGSVFFLMSSVLTTSVNQRAGVANFEQLKLRCRYAAYSGMQDALARLTTDTNYQATTVDNPVPGDPGALFDLEVYNNYAGTFVNPAPDGVVVPKKQVYIKTLGKLTAGVSTRNLTVGMATLGYVGENHFNGAAIGTKRVLMTGSRTDSYRSSSGNPSAYPYEWGCVWSNGTKNAIMLDASTVRGYAMCGPFSDIAVAIVKTNGSVVAGNSKGTEMVNTSVKRVPKYRPPFHPNLAGPAALYNAGVTALPPQGWANLTVENGATLNLQAGDYYVRDDLIVRNGAHLNALGVTKDTPCSIYVGRSVDIDASFVNDINKNGAGPGCLRIFFVGNGRAAQPLSLDITNSQACFVTSGKGLVARMDNSELWGMIKGLEVELVNSKIHYDKDMFKFYVPSYVAWTLQGLIEDNDLPMDEGVDGGDGGDGGGY